MTSAPSSIPASGDMRITGIPTKSVEEWWEVGNESPSPGGMEEVPIRPSTRQTGEGEIIMRLIILGALFAVMCSAGWARDLEPLAGVKVGHVRYHASAHARNSA